MDVINFFLLFSIMFFSLAKVHKLQWFNVRALAQRYHLDLSVTVAKQRGIDYAIYDWRLAARAGERETEREALILELSRLLDTHLHDGAIVSRESRKELCSMFPPPFSLYIRVTIQIKAGTIMRLLIEL